MNTQCDRCHTSLEGKIASMSYFNEDFCCLDCLEKEQQHPDYEKARQAEREAVQRGDLKFKGIGKPADL